MSLSRKSWGIESVLRQSITNLDVARELHIEARDLNEAIQVATRFPGARYGSIEVRPIHEMPHPK